jgi:Cu2+-exporting ATPase
MLREFRRRFWVCLGLTLPVLALSPMIQEWLGVAERVRFPAELWVLFALGTAIFIYGGWPFLKGLVDELRSGQPGMMTLIGVAISVAYGYSALVVFGIPGRVFFWELATLIDVMLLGHWIEMRSVMGASGALEEIVKLIPSDAHRLGADGQTEEVPVTELESGDLVLVKPGERIPVDGVIIDGKASVDESMITGESEPVSRGEGEEVVGGSVNGDGSLTVEVDKTGEETYLARVVQMVREAQESKSRQQDLANRAAYWLTIIALSAGSITLMAWLFLGSSFDYALERAVTVMVITCPHALGLAVPLVIAVSTAMAARRGLLIRNRTAFERSRDLDAVVFDKTGTLTEGRFGVTEVVPTGESQDEDEVLRLAAALENRSEHPIARGIAEAANARNLSLPEVEDFENLAGEGVRAEVEGHSVKVVKPGYLEERDIEFDRGRVQELAGEGKTVVCMVVDGQATGLIALADVIREESREAVRSLKEMGIQMMMITGDSRAVAAAVAEELGLDEFFAEVMPDEKADRIKELEQRGSIVAMVGDGVNDAPALAAADLGIAIGAGTDVAAETADIVLVNSDPRDVTRAVDLARRTYRKTVQNLWWAAGYNILAIPLAAGVLAWAGIVLAPAVGALIMSVSTVVVAVNARLLSLADGTPSAS